MLAQKDNSERVMGPIREKAGRPLTRASCALGFSNEVIESKLSRRSAVRSSVWLDLCVINILVLADISIIARFGIDRPIRNLPGKMSQANRPPASVVIPSKFLHASLSAENALMTEKRDNCLARGVWRVGRE